MLYKLFDFWNTFKFELLFYFKLLEERSYYSTEDKGLLLDRRDYWYFFNNLKMAKLLKSNNFSCKNILIWKTYKWFSFSKHFREHFFEEQEINHTYQSKKEIYGQIIVSDCSVLPLSYTFRQWCNCTRHTFLESRKDFFGSSVSKLASSTYKYFFIKINLFTTCSSRMGRSTSNSVLENFCSFRFKCV